MSGADEVCRVAGRLGRIWRLENWLLPPDSRRCFVELLCSLGAHLRPQQGETVQAALQHARNDVGSLADLLVRLANPGPVVLPAPVTPLASAQVLDADTPERPAKAARVLRLNDLLFDQSADAASAGGASAISLTAGDEHRPRSPSTSSLTPLPFKRTRKVDFVRASEVRGFGVADPLRKCRRRATHTSTSADASASYCPSRSKLRRPRATRVRDRLWRARRSWPPIPAPPPSATVDVAVDECRPRQ